MGVGQFSQVKSFYFIRQDFPDEGNSQVHPRLYRLHLPYEIVQG